jgi:hypothetical protein
MRDEGQGARRETKGERRKTKDGDRLGAKKAGVRAALRLSSSDFRLPVPYPLFPVPYSTQVSRMKNILNCVLQRCSSYIAPKYSPGATWRTSSRTLA